MAEQAMISVGLLRATMILSAAVSITSDAPTVSKSFGGKVNSASSPAPGVIRLTGARDALQTQHQPTGGNRSGLQKTATLALSYFLRRVFVRIKMIFHEVFRFHNEWAVARTFYLRFKLFFDNQQRRWISGNDGQQRLIHIHIHRPHRI